jgi:mono/diheme cytochrome c family protein
MTPRPSALCLLAVAAVAARGCRRTNTDARRPGVVVAADVSGAPVRLGDHAAGRPLFERNCAGCHGDEGQGGSGGSWDGPSPPDLRTSVVARDPAGLLKQIREGSGAMPSFTPLLNAKEIRDVAAFVLVDIARARSALPGSGLCGRRGVCKGNP